MTGLVAIWRCSLRECSVARFCSVVALAFGLTLACIIGMLFNFSCDLTAKTAGLSPAVRPAARAVLRANRLSVFSNGVWEDELLSQSHAVATLPVEDRVAFWRVILVNCDCCSNSQLGEDVLETIGSDGSSVRQELVRYKSTPAYGRLSGEKQRWVATWVDSFARDRTR